MHNQNRVIALGFFDGVHLGHAALLRRVREVAREINAVPAAFTFDRHPEDIILGSRQISLITTPDDRADLMSRLFDVSQVIVAHFDQHMMHMDWRDFVTHFLVGTHNAVHLVAGHDFHFGYRGEGNPQRLKALCAELGVGCDIIPKVEMDGVTVSSTYIRSLIAQGEIERANHFLGHPYVMSGPVVHGRQLGRTMGTPTANLIPPEWIITPAFGVYATKVELPQGEYLAVTNVGIRPTVSQTGAVTVEPWILDFDGNLYGQHIRVSFYQQLRLEQQFDNVAQLKAAILKNAEQTRAYFGQSTE